MRVSTGMRLKEMRYKKFFTVTGSRPVPIHSHDSIVPVLSSSFENNSDRTGGAIAM